MKKLKLKELVLIEKKVLTRAQMRDISGGFVQPPDGGGGGTTLSCYCSCNSGIGTQPSYTTVINNYDFRKSYVPGSDSCGCSTLNFTAQPGYNGGTCSVVYSA